MAVISEGNEAENYFNLSNKLRQMAVDIQLRVLKEVICMPVAQRISKYMTAIQITWLGFVFGLLSCFFVVIERNYVATFCWLINRLFDGIDGTVARLTNTQTDYGGYIDILCDFIVYSLLPITLVATYQPTQITYLLLSILQATFFVNAASLMFLSSILEKRNVGSKARGSFFLRNQRPLPPHSFTSFLYMN